MHRLFVGLRPPAAMRQALMEAMGGIVGARWQHAEQLHCTLRFIGEVDGPTAEDIESALDAVRFRQFDLAVDGIGRFGPPDRPRAVWAALAPQAIARELHRKIDRALVRLGLAPEGRAYVPHITLARLNAASGSIDRFCQYKAGLASPVCRIDHFLLYRSTLGSEGATYESIARYGLDPA